MKNITMINALMACILLFVSCAKDRPEQESQPDEVNVTKIADFQNKELSLFTLDSLSDASLLSDAATVSADLTADSISNNFSLVSYRTDSDLFEGVPLFALPGQEYKLRYEVTNKYLVINKVAKAELIPFHERTFAKKDGNLLVVPIIGYPITLLKKDLVRNANNEKTNQVIYIPVKNIADATHMNVNKAGRITFDAIKKHNVIPINFFMNEGQDELDSKGEPLAPAKEWFYASTIVGAPPALANAIGFDVTQDFTFSPVSRVKFIKNKNSIMAVNLNIDSAIDLTDENNFNIAIQIPVDWVDYRRKKEGADELLEEEELTDDSLEGETFRNRNYVKLKFTQVTTTAAFDTSFSSDYVLDDLEITKDYISFVTHHRTSGIKTRYTFRQAHTPKVAQAKRYFKNDRNIFGYFRTYKNVINNHTQLREEDREKNILINHYMPDVDKDGKRKIVYHFSKRTTNPDMIKVGRIAVDEWNKTFAKAGTGIEVVLDESKKVNLGDIRYNIINVVDNKNGGNLLGYGPTIADSKTGEIIAGSSNIYADPFREGLIRDLRNYLRSRRGLFDKNYIGSAAPFTKPIGSSAVDHVLKYIDELAQTDVDSSSLLVNEKFQKEAKKLKTARAAYLAEEKKLKELRRETPTIAEYALKVDASLKRLEDNHSLTAQDLAEFNTYGLAHHAAFQNANKDVIKELESRCGEELNEYVQELEEQNLYYNDRELEVIYGCINKVKSTKEDAPVRDRISLLQARVLSTLVHEMGHNFSLRHNFLASTDTRHFQPDDSGVTAHSASCMDYNRGNVDELITPGVYDIEAIRFAYGNAVKTESGKIITNLDKNKPLLAQIPANEKRFELKFCTDADARWLQVDPLCALHDHGDTPLKIVQENIESINAYRAMYGYRYDRANSPWGFGQGFSLLVRNFIPLKKIYSQWRYHLATFVGKENRYLENYSEQELNLILQRMAQDTGVHGKNFKEYYQAAQLAYSFLKDLAFTTAKYCIVTGDSLENKVDILEFESLQENIYKDLKVTIQNCDDKIVQDWAKQNSDLGKDAKIIGSTGENVNDIRVSLDPTSVEFLENNIAGFDSARLFAFMMLSMRSPDMFHLANLGFYPNFLDRDKNYQEIGGTLLSRSLDGINHLNSDLGFGQEQYRFLKYNRESNHLAAMMNMYENGVYIPGNPDAGSRRAGIMHTIITRDASIIPEGYLQTRYSDLYIAAHPQSPISGNLVNKRNELQMAQQIGKSQALPDVPSAELIKQAIAPIEKVVPTQEKLNSEEFLFKDLVDVSQKVAQAIEAVQAQDQRQILINFFNPHLAVAGTASQGGVFTDEDLNAPAAKVINETFGGYFTQTFANLLGEGQLPIDLFSIEFTATIPSILESIKQQKEIQDDYVRNREDRDAQLNMITDMLLRFGRF